MNLDAQLPFVLGETHCLANISDIEHYLSIDSQCESSVDLRRSAAASTHTAEFEA